MKNEMSKKGVSVEMTADRSEEVGIEQKKDDDIQV